MQFTFSGWIEERFGFFTPHPYVRFKIIIKMLHPLSPLTHEITCPLASAVIRTREVQKLVPTAQILVGGVLVKSSI